MDNVDVTLPIDFFQSEAGLEVFEFLETEEQQRVLFSLGAEKEDLRGVPKNEYISILERLI